MPSQPRLLMASSIVVATSLRTGRLNFRNSRCLTSCYAPTSSAPIFDAQDRGAIGADHAAHVRACNDSRNQCARADAAKLRDRLYSRATGTFALVLDYSLLHRALGCQRSGTKG